MAAATAGKDAKGYNFNGVVVNTNDWRLIISGPKLIHKLSQS